MMQRGARGEVAWRVVAGSRGGVVKPSFVRAAALGLAVLALVALGGCEKALSSGPPMPDFAGTWDVTFEDRLRIELRIGERTLRGQLGAEGGVVTLRDAEGRAYRVELDCARDELVCPAEMLPRELALSGPPGPLDKERTQLARSLEGRGSADCVARPGSFLTGEVLSAPDPGAQRIEAIALTGGRANVIVSASCLPEVQGLPRSAELHLWSGFTAAKR